jgi:hypothetical protein
MASLLHLFCRLKNWLDGVENLLKLRGEI